jgi:hypothetical protein
MNAPRSNLTVHIRPHGVAQFTRSLAEEIAQVLNVIPGRHPKLAHEIFGRGLNVPVVASCAAGFAALVLGPAEVGIAGDGGGAAEALEAGLGFGLRVGVVGVAAEEFVRGDALLRAEFGAGVLFGCIWD